MNKFQISILICLINGMILSGCLPVASSKTPTTINIPITTSTFPPSATAITSRTPSPTLTPTQTTTPTQTPTPSSTPTSTPPGELVTLDNLDQIQILGTWEFTQTYAAHGPFIAWAPDSTRFSILTPHEIFEYKVDTLSITEEIPFPRDVLAGLAYSPDGSSIIASGPGYLINYTNHLKQEFQRPPCDAFGELAISPDGQYIVTHTASRLYIGGNLYLSLWHYPDYTCEGLIFDGYASTFTNMVFSPNSQYFAALAGSNVKIWNIPTQEIVCEIQGYGAILAFSPNGMLAIGGGEGLSLWDPNTCQIVQEHRYLFFKSEFTDAIQWNPDGSMLVFSNYVSKLRVRLYFWDVARNEMKITKEIDSMIIDQLVFSPNGHYFLTSSQEWEREAPGQVTLWGIK